MVANGYNNTITTNKIKSPPQKKIRQKQNIKYNNYKEKTNLNIYSEDTFLIINPFEGRTRGSFVR